MNFNEYLKDAEVKIALLAKDVKRMALARYLEDMMLDIAEAYTEVFPEGDELRITFDMERGSVFASDNGDFFACRVIRKKDEEDE